MKTMLVLTDFSDAATHAAMYGCILAKQLHSQKIILYHSYHADVIYGEEAIVISNDNPIWQSSMNKLQELQTDMQQHCPSVNIDLRTDIISLMDINNIMAEEDATLIVMGTAGKTKLEEIILGSSAITVCKHSNYPVLLVPVQATMEPIRHIAFACDLQAIEKTIPLQQLKTILSDFNVPLTIVNISDENKFFARDTRKNSFALHDMLKEYTPSYYNSNSNNVVAGIMEFAVEYPSTLIVLIAKKQNFMEGILYRSFTRKLSYISPFPLLVLREPKH